MAKAPKRITGKMLRYLEEEMNKESHPISSTGKYELRKKEYEDALKDREAWLKYKNAPQGPKAPYNVYNWISDVYKLNKRLENNDITQEEYNVEKNKLDKRRTKFRNIMRAQWGNYKYETTPEGELKRTFTGDEWEKAREAALAEAGAEAFQEHGIGTPFLPYTQEDFQRDKDRIRKDESIEDKFKAIEEKRELLKGWERYNKGEEFYGAKNPELFKKIPPRKMFKDLKFDNSETEPAKESSQDQESPRGTISFPKDPILTKEQLSDPTHIEAEERSLASKFADLHNEDLKNVVRHPGNYGLKFAKPNEVGDIEYAKQGWPASTTFQVSPDLRKFFIDRELARVEHAKAKSDYKERKSKYNLERENPTIDPLNVNAGYGSMSGLIAQQAIRNEKTPIMEELRNKRKSELVKDWGQYREGAKRKIKNYENKWGEDLY